MRRNTAPSSGSLRTMLDLFDVAAAIGDVLMLRRSLSHIVSRIVVIGGDSKPAATTAARRQSSAVSRRSSIHPSVSRLTELFRTTPGATTVLLASTTAPTICSGVITERKDGARAKIDAEGGRGLSSGNPTGYHQGIPFCAKTTSVLDEIIGASSAPSANSACAFTVTKRASCAPQSAGRLVAKTVARRSPSEVRKVSPDKRIASRFGPRVTAQT